MFRNPEEILVPRPLEFSIPFASRRRACLNRKIRQATVARIAHACAAILLERIVPMVSVAMPEKALVRSGWHLDAVR
jgi:hypothetical protein